ncbi:MAG TPA: DNA repair protein RadC [Sandaracinaceae bacterium LLY-WYZ-13_1]|nr:DNA repair protein RadC [Sandaracinaceae bacterium LLY-WYZ-13_1]
MDRSYGSAGPRERLRAVGTERLSDAELLALLLGTGARREPVSVLASRLLHELGGLEALRRVGPGALEKLPGVGPSKAGRIVAAVELGRRLATRPLPRGTRIASSRAVYAALRPRLAHLDAERFLALALDAKNRPIAEVEIARGGLSACPVSPSDVFRALLREAAAGVVFVHNHPSGEPSPSAEDVALTERLRRAGDLLGVAVLDHVIIGREGYFSFLDSGLLAPEPARPSAPSP